MRNLFKRLKISLPWQVKITAKLMLSHLPLPYGFWKGLGLFEHGQMEQPEYAYRIFKQHFDRAGFGQRNPGFAVLELGPGDALFTAVIARRLGRP